VAAILLAISGVLFFYGLNAGDLYRTEGLRAIIAAEFLRTGNWIVPTLYGEPRFTKPPGMYAAIALLSWPVGGVTDWSARLPSALAATCTVLLFYWYFARQLGRRGGLVAAIILPCSFMWLEKATAAEIDMMQVAWVTAAILFFLRALEVEEGKETRRQGDKETAVLASRAMFGVRGAPLFQLPEEPVSLSPCLRVSLSAPLWWLAALLCVAGGVLTKWTAPAFFYGTAVPLLWWRGRLRLLVGRHHLVSAAVGALVCLTWIGAAAAMTGWDVFYQTVSREAFMRLLPSHHDRPYPWHETLAHPFRLLATNLPWSILALLTLRPSFIKQWDLRGRRLLQALHCWTWPNIFFWTIIPEHATRHSFPLFPGIAGLAAMVWIAQGQRWSIGRLRIRTGAALVAVLLLWLVVKVVHVDAVIPTRNWHRDPRAKGELLARLVPEGEILYLFKLKDEGVMFYYGRTVRRLASPALLPSSDQPLYCILDEPEFADWHLPLAIEVVQRLTDQQGDPIVLVRVQQASAVPFGSEHGTKEFDRWTPGSYPAAPRSSASAN
jgi:4-amino-4-deoxy-L-arabinose transferase-like glycosyltransferase